MLCTRLVRSSRPAYRPDHARPQPTRGEAERRPRFQSALLLSSQWLIEWDMLIPEKHSIMIRTIPQKASTVALTNNHLLLPLHREQPVHTPLNRLFYVAGSTAQLEYQPDPRYLAQWPPGLDTESRDSPAVCAVCALDC